MEKQHRRDDGSPAIQTQVVQRNRNHFNRIETPIEPANLGRRVSDPKDWVGSAV